METVQAASAGGMTTQQQQQAAMASMQETLAAIPAATMAQTAATVAVAPPLGAVPPPSLTDCILCDHSATLTLFNHFFQSAHIGNAVNMDMTAAALAVELRLHSQAEMQVLYPLLQSRMGANGAQWAARSLAEHALVEQSVADVLVLRSVGGDALINRMKQLQTEFITHQAEEENAVLPAVAAALSQEESLALAAQFKAAKQVAPLAPQAPAVLAAQAAALNAVAAAAGAAQPAPSAGGAAPSAGAAPTPSTVTTGTEGGGGAQGTAPGAVTSPGAGEADTGASGGPPPAAAAAPPASKQVPVEGQEGRERVLGAEA